MSIPVIFVLITCIAILVILVQVHRFLDYFPSLAGFLIHDEVLGIFDSKSNWNTLNWFPFSLPLFLPSFRFRCQ